MPCDLQAVPGLTVQARMNSRAFSERIPLHAEIEIIGTCNFKCVHCYIAPCAHREDVMSVADATAIFRKLADAGCFSVLLTGGEIFTHKQFREIYLAAKRFGFVIFLNTNGYLISKKWVDFFDEYPPRQISISLYGATPETYEKVTGIPNSFERCLRNVDLLLERGINLDLKCPAFTLTVDELPALRQLAADRGLSFRTDSMMNPRRTAGSEPVSLQLAPRQVMELEQKLDPGLEVLKAFASTRIGVHPGQDKVYQCGAGKISLAIGVHGEVTTCLSSRMPVGNLIEQPWDEVWAALGGKTDRKFPDGHPCATCKFRSMCSGCPATVEQMTGLPEGYVQHYCKVTHLQAQQLGYHPTGVPRTVTEGVPAGIRTTGREYLRALPVIG